MAPHFLPHYLTNEFLLFQLLHCREVHTIGDVSTPRMNGKVAHLCPVANNITKKAVKRQGMKPCPSHFLPHYLTNEFSFFQLHHCRVVHTIGDISAPRMNGKPATPSPWCQQHSQEGCKRARYETMPSTFSTQLSH
jgi:hypothetical protein